MAVTLYGDESESQQPAVFTLAGFIASPTGWRGFAVAWREMLRTAGPHPVDALHANPLDKGEPPFDGWLPFERDAFLYSAIDILADTNLAANLYAIGCTFAVDELRAVDVRLLGEGKTQHVYELCYRVLFHNLLRFSPFKGIDMVFDRKKKAEGRVQAHFDVSKNYLDADPQAAGTLHTCTFDDDETVVQIQAADLLAFELRRRAWDRLRDETIPPRAAYQRLKEIFQKTSVDSKPPYRQRIFRCYDRRFINSLMAEIVKEEHQPITEEDLVELWYHMDAPED